MKLRLFCAAAALATAIVHPADAHEGDGGKVTYASDHAPIGVMADHRHKQGEWMMSYRYMYMDMSMCMCARACVDVDARACVYVCVCIGLRLCACV